MAKMSAAVEVGRSVPAKQANSTLDILCSLGLLFIAKITSRFNKMMRGQLNMLRIIEAGVET